MDCLIRLFAVCLFDPSAVAVEADLSWRTGGAFRYTYAGEPYYGALGRAAVLVDVPATPTLTLRYGLEHRSFAENSVDRGVESVVTGLVWRPFARR